jgi:hypothetical protein
MERKNSSILEIISILIIIFMAGCTQLESTIIPVDLDDPFQLKINQVGLIKSENVKIVFVNITEDSRCPSDVECVWEGQATILINIIKNKQVLGEFNLTSREGFDELAIKEYDGYSIELMIVEPYPISTQKIDRSEYTATFIVTKILS